MQLNTEAQPAYNNKTTSSSAASNFQPFSHQTAAAASHSSQMIYHPEVCIGKGTFGRVMRCIECLVSSAQTTNYSPTMPGGYYSLPRNHRSILPTKRVAVKVIRQHATFVRQGQIEVQTLKKLNAYHSHRFNLIRMLDTFVSSQHELCIAFELLDCNLYDFLRRRAFRPMSLRAIRIITNQVAVALGHLHGIGVIHSDLKPENIMFVNQTTMPHVVKVIDLGSACKIGDTHNLTYLQSRYYRSPEVLLSVPFDEKIDLWSLGCVAVELFLGTPLYPGISEYDQIKFILQTQGLFPDHMIAQSSKAQKIYFSTTWPAVDNSPMWGFNSLEKVISRLGKEVKSKETRKYLLKNLSSLVLFENGDDLNPGLKSDSDESAADTLDRIQYVQMVTALLALDPKSRLSANECLHTEFLTMEHMQRDDSNFTHTYHYNLSLYALKQAAQNSTLSGTGWSNSLYSQNSANERPIERSYSLSSMMMMQQQQPNYGGQQRTSAMSLMPHHHHHLNSAANFSSASGVNSASESSQGSFLSGTMEEYSEPSIVSTTCCTANDLNVQPHSVVSLMPSSMMKDGDFASY